MPQLQVTERVGTWQSISISKQGCVGHVRAMRAVRGTVGTRHVPQVYKLSSSTYRRTVQPL
jgi:hypothetical protein